jgi:hypothetical protein
VYRSVRPRRAQRAEESWLASIFVEAEHGFSAQYASTRLIFTDRARARVVLVASLRMITGANRRFEAYGLTGCPQNAPDDQQSEVAPAAGRGEQA